MTFKTNTMDSIENRSLTDVATQEAAEVLAVTEVIATPIQSKEEVITRLQAINQQEELADKTELDTLKQTFYRLRNAEVEAAQKTFEENGGDVAAFVAPKDDLETQFKEIMSSIREKRNALKAAEEQEKQANLAKKLAIIEQMKELADSPEDAKRLTMNSRSYKLNGMKSRTFLRIRRTNYGKVISFKLKNFTTYSS